MRIEEMKKRKCGKLYDNAGVKIPWEALNMAVKKRISKINFFLVNSKSTHKTTLCAVTSNLLISNRQFV